MNRRITRETINEYLKRGYHVHIRSKDKKGNNRIMETILVVGIPYHHICNDVRKKLDTPKIETPENMIVVVASRAFLSPRDKSNRQVPNEVIVGRIIRKIEEGRGLSFDEEIDLCGDMSVFLTWLNMGLPPRKRDVKKIAVIRYQDPECIKEAEKEVKLYKEHVESTRSIDEYNKTV